MKESIKKHYFKLVKVCLPYYQLVKFGSCGPLYKWPLSAVVKMNLKKYKKWYGQKCNFKHPVLFTEKIQRYKFFFNHPDINRITDKVQFKQYIQEKLGEGYVIPMFGAWDNIQEIEEEWNKADGVLPEEFVFKSNLQSDGRGIIIIHKKSDMDFLAIKSELDYYLDVKNTLMNSISKHLYWSKPMILAEQYMANFEDQLFDYKFFCFDGEIFCIYVAQDHFGQDGSHISFYDINWNKLNVKYGDHLVGDAPRPKHYEEMKEIAVKLSTGFPFLRVDFFDTNEKLFVAELTFDPGGGFTPYYPESFNRALGDKFILPK